MSVSFIIIALVTLISALAAVSLRRLVHCALSLTITFAGIGAFYLQLHAEFVGFAQLLVYIGAVAILIVFAILLTRGGDTQAGEKTGKASGWVGLVIAILSFGCLTGAVLASSNIMHFPVPPAPALAVEPLGRKLVGEYVLPLEVLGLLLTAGVIGAVLMAVHGKTPPASGQPSSATAEPVISGAHGSHPRREE